MFQTTSIPIPVSDFSISDISDFEIVSDFELRISDFDSEPAGS
jgi:hypothetical protein